MSRHSCFGRVKIHVCSLIKSTLKQSKQLNTPTALKSTLEQFNQLPTLIVTLIPLFTVVIMWNHKTFFAFLAVGANTGQLHHVSASSLRAGHTEPAENVRAKALSFNGVDKIADL